MPIPTTVTQEDQDRWTASWNLFWSSGAAQEKGVPEWLRWDDEEKTSDTRSMHRIWWPGEWLAEGLRRLNASDDEVQEILFCAGRRQAMSPDPWVAVTQAFEDYERGVVNRNVPILASTSDAVIIVSDGNRPTESNEESNT